MKTEVNKITHGNCFEVLKTMPNKYINCCVTSPPYWGLRDYGTAIWIGGDADCGHIKNHNSMQSSKSTLGGRKPEQTLNDKRRDMVEIYKNKCDKCGAIKKDNQLGLEPTPEKYVENMVKVFGEVKRVLKDDGTLWLNLGDSYYNFRGYSDYAVKQSCAKNDAHVMSSPFGKRNVRQSNLKGKDLVGIPWMVAFALRSDGWYLRQDIIWHKPNPMPESVTDRCTKSHEYIFLLSKSHKYYYDADAIKEELKEKSIKRNQTGWAGNEDRSYVDGPQNHMSKYLGSEKAKKETHRNKRSVWTVNTKPFKKAHFAVFPEKLIEPCVLAGCPKGGIVLDPFIGSGTTGKVARKFHRNFIGIELNKKYIDDISLDRVNNVQPVLF